MPRRRTPINLADVAAAAHVSSALASKVLNGNRSTTRVAEHTAVRIRAVAERLGYRRNAAAFAYRSGRFRTIAVCSRNAIGPTHHGVLSHAVRELEGAGYLTLSAELDDVRIGDPGYTPHLFRELRVDGMLLHFNHHVREQDVRAVASFGVPAVWINSYAEVDSVIPDDGDAGRQAVQALVNAGRRNIAYVQPRIGAFPLGPHPSRAERVQGAQLMAAAAGMSLRCFDPPQGDTLHEAITAWRRVIVDHPDIDGWIIEGGSGEIHLGHVLAAAGLRLRHDVDVAVIDPVSPVTGLSDFYRVRLPLAYMVQAAVAMLLSKLADPQATHACQVIPIPAFI